MKTLSRCRTGTLPFPKSLQGAGQQHARLLRQYMRAYSGGGMFGYDTRTLAINEPEVFARLTAIERAFREES